jgi:hypothetical protein
VTAPEELTGQEAAILAQLDAVRARMEVAQGYALDGVTAAAQRRHAAEEELDAAVRTARGLRITWERIARAAGMTRQSAWQRWAEQ